MVVRLANGFADLTLEPGVESTIDHRLCTPVPAGRGLFPAFGDTNDLLEVLSLDPRPAYRRGPEPGRIYGVQLAGLNIRWQIDGAGAEVVDIKPVAPG